MAFVLIQMSVTDNTYRSALFVKNIVTGDVTAFGTAGPPVHDFVGNLRAMVPRLSPDGRCVALIVPVAGIRQVIAWDVGSGVRAQLTYESRDVLAFDWLPSGAEIGIAVRSNGENAAERGPMRPAVRVTASTMTSYGSPFLDGASERSPPVEYRAVSVRTEERRSRLIDPEMVAGLDLPVSFGERPAGSMQKSPGRQWIARISTAGGETATLQFTDSRDVPIGESIKLGARIRGQPEIVGWLPSGRELVYLGSPRFGERLLFEVNPTAKPREIPTSGAHRYLEKCTVARLRSIVLCTSQDPKTLPRLVVIDLEHGQEQVVVAPNSYLSDRAIARVERTSWMLSDGSSVEGWIMRPPDSFPKPRAAVISVYYFPGSFLDSGGEEVALQELVANGITVICLHVPPNRKEGDAFDKAIRDWERPLEAYRVVIESMAGAGEIDRSRVGIIGLSFGSELVSHAVTHSTLFAAAASAGGGSIDPTQVAHVLPGAGLYYTSPGLAWWEEPESLARWQRLSPALNARAVQTPLLFQAADREAALSFFFIGQLMRFKKPFEAWIYDRELHQKIWPANKLLVNERNLDWFRFWLKNEEDPDPVKVEQYRRWRELRRY